MDQQTIIAIGLMILVGFLSFLTVFHPTGANITGPLALSTLTGLFAFLQVKKD